MIDDTHWIYLPEKPCDITIAGIDQGRGEHYVYICRFYLPPNNKPINYASITEKTFREVVFCQPVNHYEISSLLQAYNVDFGFIDNEPDRFMAKDITENTCLMSADQRPYIPQLQKLSKVETGGIELETVLIDNRYFLDMVFSNFLNGTIKTDWKSNDNGIHSPARHFKAMHRDDEGRWIRAKDHIDDFYFAAMFCESAFYYKLDELIRHLNDKENINWYEKFSTEIIDEIYLNYQDNA
jgi:hypothetical protein